MSESLPERADLRQLRTQAKELVSALQTRNPEALSLASSHDPALDPSKAKLVDAQRLLARKYGFESWPKIVEQVEAPILKERLVTAFHTGDAKTIEDLLKRKPALRKLLNEPIMGFDSPPIVVAARHPNAAKVLPVLARYGADPNARSKWWAGGFSALDGAKDETVDVLLNLGAKFDVWSAASHGRVDILEQLLKEDPSSVNAPGGDGQTPLHFASTPEVAEFLIQHGADLEIKDVDHKATPAQYQVTNPEVLRVLLRHGAKPDVFTAAALGDVDLLRKILAEDPNAALARVGSGPFVAPEPAGGHIYEYNLGSGKTPQQVAAQFGNLDVLHELEAHSSPSRLMVAYAWREDREKVREILANHPDLVASLAPEEARAIADAAMAGRTETVRILLEAGLDPTQTGMDSGTSLHIACWFGFLPIVQMLVNHVPLDLLDAHHGSPPLGWATHGAQWCRNEKGDHVAVVETLIAAGADPNAPANRGGTTMQKQAGDREDVKAVLKRHGAK